MPPRIAATLAAPLALLAYALAGTGGAAATARAAECPSRNAPAGSISAGKAEKALLCLVNRAREKRGLAELSRRVELDQAADDHSIVMVANGCFKHRCPGELRLAERLEKYLAAGGQGYGENIANGVREAGSARTIVRAWLSDDGNRANVLDPDYEHIGIGVEDGIPGDPKAQGFTYTADFGYVSTG